MARWLKEGQGSGRDPTKKRTEKPMSTGLKEDADARKSKRGRFKRNKKGDKMTMRVWNGAGRNGVGVKC